MQTRIKRGNSEGLSHQVNHAAAVGIRDLYKTISATPSSSPPMISRQPPFPRRAEAIPGYDDVSRRPQRRDPRASPGPFPQPPVDTGSGLVAVARSDCAVTSRRPHWIAWHAQRLDRSGSKRTSLMTRMAPSAAGPAVDRKSVV